jgi:hypothetical protein
MGEGLMSYVIVGVVGLLLFAILVVLVGCEITYCKLVS